MPQTSSKSIINSENGTRTEPSKYSFFQTHIRGKNIKLNKINLYEVIGQQTIMLNLSLNLRLYKTSIKDYKKRKKRQTDIVKRDREIIF